MDQDYEYAYPLWKNESPDPEVYKCGYGSNRFSKSGTVGYHSRFPVKVTGPEKYLTLQYRYPV